MRDEGHRTNGERDHDEGEAHQRHEVGLQIAGRRVVGRIQQDRGHEQSQCQLRVQHYRRHARQQCNGGAGEREQCRVRRPDPVGPQRQYCPHEQQADHQLEKHHSPTVLQKIPAVPVNMNWARLRSSRRQRLA